MAEAIPKLQDEPTESELQPEENCKEIEGNLTEDDSSKVKAEASVEEGREQLSDPVEGLVKDGTGNQIGEITSDQTEESINEEPKETPAEESDDNTGIKPEETPTAAEPEGTPTEQPEGTPEQPEGTPTEQPEGTPTEQPEGTPTEQPEGTPEQPEGTPTEQPEGTPEQPEGTPTEQPEGTPTEQPEGTPTEQPEGTPTEQPEGTPTEQPEGTPTEQPEGTPTEQPEGTPTEQSKGVPVEHSEGMASTEQPENTPSEQPKTENIGDVSDEVIEEPVLTREDMMTELKEQLSTLDVLRAMNAHLQNKIADYLAKKKTEDRHDPSKSVTDHEQRYLKCLDALESLQAEEAAMEERRRLEKMEAEEQSRVHLSLVEAKKLEYVAFCKQQSLQAIYSRTGKKLTSQEFDRLVADDSHKEKEVIQARLENIRLQTVIEKKEALVKQKEELGEGLHVIDFEQLKIDNVNLNEKIEERNEDLIKLRKKITGTVQVLTHVKEKLQFMQAENGEKKDRLSELEYHLSRKRDHLTRVKQARDALRIDNVKLRHHGGLVSHLDLLQDFEDQVDKNEEKTGTIEEMQAQYGSTMMACKKIRKKVTQTNLLPNIV